MSIATELIALLERYAAKLPPPRVRALHLPPPPAEGAKNGEFCALELEDGAVGLSYVLLGDTLAHLAASGDIAGAASLDVARHYLGADPARRALGFAAVNALTASLFARAGYQPDNSADSIGLLDPRPGDHVGMIGLFRPLVGRIAGAGAQLTVAELKAELAGEQAGYRVTLEAEDLAPCNKVLSTSTVLLNDTLDRMIAACRSARYFALVGPGAGCLPDPLFARGVTLLGGTRVTDLPGLRAALPTGQSWSHCAAKFAIRREDYPGFEALLARAR